MCQTTPTLLGSNDLREYELVESLLTKSPLLERWHTRPRFPRPSNRAKILTGNWNLCLSAPPIA
jgi:hypothetical protein